MKRAAAFLGFAFLLMFPAFWNGFPLVYSDTGTYIASGMQSNIPQDRPLVYGFFIRHSSLLESLWLSIFAQAIIAAALTYVFAKLFLAETLKPRSFFLVGLLMCLFSTLPWYSSFLMADAFTGFSYLLLLFLFFGLNQKPWRWGFLIIFYWFVTAAHLSQATGHLLVWAVLLVSSSFKWVRNSISIKRTLWVGAIILCNYLFLPSFHYLAGNQFTYPKRSYYFISARFIENGSMKEILDKNCPNANWQMCQYKDSLPNCASDFLWTENSPLIKLKGWEKELTELKDINKAVLSDPNLLVKNLNYLAKVSWKQTFQTAVAEEYLPYDSLSPPGYIIGYYFKPEFKSYLNSKQQQNQALKISQPLSNWMYYSLLLSLLILLTSLIIGFGSNRQKLITLMLLLGYMGNVVAVSVASEGARYNSRYYWVIVLGAILILFKYFKEKWRFKGS